NPPVSSVSIRLNPKARKVGVPKKAKKKIVAGERADRKWYEAAKEGRKKAGEVTLLAVVNSLDHVQPGLREVQRRLSGIIVKQAWKCISGFSKSQFPLYQLLTTELELKLQTMC
ncbi:hypothetical protein L916_11199, partial [Phytophthora nicotianae]